MSNEWNALADKLRACIEATKHMAADVRLQAAHQFGATPLSVTLGDLAKASEGLEEQCRRRAEAEAALAATAWAKQLRPEIIAFALLMERELRANDERKGKVGWKNCDPRDLIPRIYDEAEELEKEVGFTFNPVWFAAKPDHNWYGGWMVRERDGVTEYANPDNVEFRPHDAVQSARRIGSEAADIANMAMMVADVCGALSELPNLDGGE